ncbi:uncharacterized protein LOC114907626 [Monodon monoceros]|uniref:uncharacterized protein LOC114907626 n=1 Tax=Monodon monoceros TaxID=40151 RepID=UPI0010F861D7|nr:uncharacterized protein LOC114907626 [Monodon monoceros]
MGGREGEESARRRCPTEGPVPSRDDDPGCRICPPGRRRHGRPGGVEPAARAEVRVHSPRCAPLVPRRARLSASPSASPSAPLSARLELGSPAAARGGARRGGAGRVEGRAEPAPGPLPALPPPPPGRGLSRGRGGGRAGADAPRPAAHPGPDLGAPRVRPEPRSPVARPPRRTPSSPGLNAESQPPPCCPQRSLARNLSQPGPQCPRPEDGPGHLGQSWGHILQDLRPSPGPLGAPSIPARRQMAQRLPPHIRAAAVDPECAPPPCRGPPEPRTGVWAAVDTPQAQGVAEGSGWQRRPGVGTELQHRLDYQVEVTLGWKAYLSIMEPLYPAQTFT